MIEERTLGVAEARIGVAVIGCLLGALGYVVVDRLVNSARSAAQPAAANQSVGTEADAADRPRVARQPDAGNAW